MRIALGVTPISPGSPWSDASGCARESRIGPVSHGQGPPPWLRKYVGSNSPGPVVAEVSVIGVLDRRTPHPWLHGPAARRSRLGRRRSLRPRRRSRASRTAGSGGRSRRHHLILGLVGGGLPERVQERLRSEEHTSELQSLMRISYAVFCLKKKNTN